MQRTDGRRARQSYSPLTFLNQSRAGRVSNGIGAGLGLTPQYGQIGFSARTKVPHQSQIISGTAGSNWRAGAVIALVPRPVRVPDRVVRHLSPATALIQPVRKDMAPVPEKQDRYGAE